MGVKAQEDRRFRRPKARPASRRRREHLRWLLAGTRAAVVAGVLVGSAYAVTREALTSSFFAIERIVVTGNHRLGAGEVMALLDGLRGQNVFRADLAAWRERVLTSPWVGSADLRRVLPRAVEVALVEREPLGIGRADGRLFLLDGRGRVIDDYGPNYADLDLPIVDGLAGTSGSARESRAALAGRFFGALMLRGDLTGRVSQIDVTDARDLVAMLHDDPARLHLGDRAFVERLDAYLELAPALRTRVPAIDYVDLRFEARVFVRPAEDTVALAAPSAPAPEPPAFR